MTKTLLLFALLLGSALPAAAQVSPTLCPASAPSQTGLQRDWKRAIWRVPLHIALSLPATAASVVIPPIGKKYVRWRIAAETKDAADGADTCMKATIDLYSQTALPRAVLRVYGVQFQ